MKRTIVSFAIAAMMAASAAQADCSVSSSVTTGPDGTTVSGTPGKAVTIYDSEGRAIGVIAKSDDCDAGGGTSAGGASTAVGSGDGSSSAAAGSSAGSSSSVTTGSGGGASTTTEGGLSSSVTVGPGGVSGETRIK